MCYNAIILNILFIKVDIDKHTNIININLNNEIDIVNEETDVKTDDISNKNGNNANH